MKTAIAPLAALALAACSQQASPPANDQNAAVAEATPVPGATPSPAPAEANALTATGWGPLRIGMTRAEITAALGADANPEAVGGPDPEACDIYRPAQAPKGMLVMVESGKLTRITLRDESGLATDAALRIGASAAAVRAAYGDRLIAEPHKYIEAPAKYLTVWTGAKPTEPYVEDASRRGIRYEIGRDGRVTAIHAGGPSIQYVEGCA